MTYCSDDLLNSNFYIIVVPTPIVTRYKISFPKPTTYNASRVRI